MAEIIWAEWGYDLMNLCRYIYNGQQTYSYDDATSLEQEWGYAVDAVANADISVVLDAVIATSNANNLVIKPMMIDTGNGFKAGITFGDVSRVGTVYEVALKGLFTQAPFIDVFGALTNAAGYDIEANRLAQIGADVLGDILGREVSVSELPNYKVNVYAEKEGGGGGGGADEDNEIITHINEEVAQTILDSMANCDLFQGTEITEDLGTNIHAVDVDPVAPTIPDINTIWYETGLWITRIMNTSVIYDRNAELMVEAMNLFHTTILPTIELPETGIVVFTERIYGYTQYDSPRVEWALGYIPSYDAIDQYQSNKNNIYFTIVKRDIYDTSIKDTYQIWRKNNGAWSNPANPQRLTPGYSQEQYKIQVMPNSNYPRYAGQTIRAWESHYDSTEGQMVIDEISDPSVGTTAASYLFVVAGIFAHKASTGGVVGFSNAFNEMSGNINVTVQEGAESATKENHDIDNWGTWLPRIYHGIDEDTGDISTVRNIPIDITNTKDVADVLSVPQALAQAGVEAIPMGASYADSIAVPGTIDWLREMGLITVPSIADKDKAITIADEGAPTPTPTPIVPVLPPEITAQRLYTVHSVSQTEINNLGAYLWSTDFISLITNMFNAPIDAVIGLHTLYYGGSLPLGSNEVIKLGAVLAQSETVTCTGTRVTNQFMKFDCGSVAIPEYYGNVEDYAGYSKCEIFLPFIGFRELDINEIMGGSVYVRYGIDIFTGACVATIGVMRDGVSNALYAYEGNCAIQQPVTSADYSRLISGIISAGIAIAAGAASGGAGAAIGAASLLSGHKITYPRSGGLTANAGACLQKQPYIIIKRPKAYDASNYPAFYGNVTNWTVTLGQCHGYTRIKDVHLDNVACTDAEKDEILSLLKQGVIF